MVIFMVALVAGERSRMGNYGLEMEWWRPSAQISRSRQALPGSPHSQPSLQARRR
jgi:hypothetical protein